MDKSTATMHGPGPGLVSGLTGLAKNVFGLLVSRVELAAVELEEVRNHILELMAVFALAFICILFAIGFGTATIVALTWEAMGWKILVLMFVVFLGITAALVFKGKAMLKENKLALPETMNELKHDRDMLL
jgi:uncharacterized membrane protein YqjE